MSADAGNAFVERGGSGSVAACRRDEKTPATTTERIRRVLCISYSNEFRFCGLRVSAGEKRSGRANRVPGLQASPLDAVKLCWALVQGQLTINALGALWHERP